MTIAKGDIRTGFRACASVPALALMLAATAAHAQEAQAPQDAPAAPPVEANSEDSTTAIVVTGTRIQANGYTQPTPVTTVSGDQLTLSSPGSLSQSLAPLPALRLSSNPQGGQVSSGNQGAISQLNLRGLGVNRTLVLLDGHRLTPANTGSAPDINMLPQMLIQRVDVVTGGASAAYGSDAVSGVVNFILNRNFRGFRVEGSAGVSSRGDGASQRLGAAFGVHLLDNRLHIIGSAEYYNRGAVYPSPQRGWTTGHYLPLTNPAVNANNPASPDNPTFIIAPDATVASGTPGGLITSGPLANTQFINGQPVPFVGGNLRTAGFMQGGDGVWSGNIAALSLPLRRNVEFLQASFDVTDHVELFVSGSHGYQDAPSLTQITSQNFTIFAGNPFIPAGLNVSGLASFPLSKFNLDVGGSQIDDTGTNWEFTAGARGDFMAGSHRWRWDVTYQNGRSTYQRRLLNNINQVNVYNAADSVTVTPQNVGSSGFAIGSIVCRTSLTNPTNGCVPINPFIPLSQNSPEALDYIFFEAWFKQAIRQQSVQANISGDLAQGWAGPISVAFGAEYRRINTTVTSDPLSQTLPADYIAQTAAGIRGLPSSANSPNRGLGAFGNFQPLDGGYNVKEVFAELNLPLLDHSAIGSAELNGAYRYTDYSTSGGVSSWKVGLVWDPVNELRLRATRSRDIRAPNIVELLSPSRQQGTTITDPFLGNAAFATARFDQGNPNLTPERADTWTAGIVFRPRGSSGFSASIDAYDIKIHDAIVLLVAQDVVNNCFNGLQDYCSLITRANNSPTGVITGINTTYFNGQEIHQRGIDFEASYRTSLSAISSGLNGNLTLRGLLNYVDKYSLSQGPGVPAIDKAGEVGAPASGSSGIYGIPHWSGTISATYANRGFTAYLQGRYVGGGNYDNTFNTDRYNAPGQPITYINDNHISGRFYTDLTLRHDFSGSLSGLQIFGTVENLFDVDPPIDPSRASTLPTQTNGYLYDTIGRRFTMGARINF